jgi:hypothetical protein
MLLLEGIFQILRAQGTTFSTYNLAILMSTNLSGQTI